MNKKMSEKMKKVDSPKKVNPKKSKKSKKK